jgi:hypothetical protein
MELTANPYNIYSVFISLYFSKCKILMDLTQVAVAY